MSGKKIALLYQALPPPIIDGLRKDGKPGGYSDGGADIAFTLYKNHHNVITPHADPSPKNALDWVFPDTEVGISEALFNGATHIWLNTVLFKGHPAEQIPVNIYKIGQTTEATQLYDDKFLTNFLLREAGLPVANSYLLGNQVHKDILSFSTLLDKINQKQLDFPMVTKPVRGRGSQGVNVVDDFDQLQASFQKLLQEQKFGTYFIIEELLKGEEITLTIMPPIAGSDRWAERSEYWSLRPVKRFDQKNYVAPYNGEVPVIENSIAIDETELQSTVMQSIISACIQATNIIKPKAPIRIDCRADKHGTYRIFDLNMKPNMTGAGRPGREKQDCLSMIAARADGWQFIDLLDMMIASAWH